MCKLLFLNCTKKGKPTEIQNDYDKKVIFKKNDQRNSYFSYKMYLSDKIIDYLEEKIEKLENENKALRGKINNFSS